MDCTEAEEEMEAEALVGGEPCINLGVESAAAVARRARWATPTMASYPAVALDKFDPEDEAELGFQGGETLIVLPDPAPEVSDPRLRS